MRLAILGFGLIGGSIARAVTNHEPGKWSIAAWSPSGDGPRRAREDGVIETAAADPGVALESADLVVLAAPPLACLAWLDEIGGGLRSRLAPGVVVTDVASTKRVIVRRAAELRLPFVGGHPMAGRELAGYQAAEPKLFVDRPWVVCEGDATQEAVKRVEELARDAGARPIHLDPDVHDAAVAAVSHLPLVVSAALVEAVVGRGAGDWREARPLAAGGWHSMTRLAGGEVELGAGILATNADNVAQRLTALRAVIDDWITLLGSDAPDVAALRGRLESAKRTLELDSG